MTSLVEKERPRYQLLPPLSEDEYAALRDDIKSAGVRVPIDVDENGAILDGHHRKAIADELGVECPERVIRDLPEFAKVDYALSVNLARRHLTGEQKSKLVKASLKRDPRLSNREHARRCGVAHSFVAGLRAVLEDAGQLDSESSRVGADGRTRSLPKPRLESDSNPPVVPQVDSEATSSTESNGRSPLVESDSTSAPVDRSSRADQPVVADPGPATPAAAGDDPPPAAAWDPAERKAHEAQVQVRKDIESARSFARTFVTEVRNQCFTILAGYRLGERHLVTAEQIADCRRALDQLEQEVLADAQR